MLETSELLGDRRVFEKIAQALLPFLASEQRGAFRGIPADSRDDVRDRDRDAERYLRGVGRGGEPRGGSQAYQNPVVPGKKRGRLLATTGRSRSWGRDRSWLFFVVLARFEASEEPQEAGGLPGSVTPVRRQRNQHPGFHELVDRPVHCWFGSIHAGYTYWNCDHGMSRQDVDELPGRGILSYLSVGGEPSAPHVLEFADLGKVVARELRGPRRGY